jgi:hypothetical protein
MAARLRVANDVGRGDGGDQDEDGGEGELHFDEW